MCGFQWLIFWTKFSQSSYLTFTGGGFISCPKHANITRHKDIQLRINRHTAPTWETCWMMNRVTQHRDGECVCVCVCGLRRLLFLHSPVQQEEEEERGGGWAREPKNWKFFGLKCLRLKCKQDDSVGPQQRDCGSFHCRLNRVFYTFIIQPLFSQAGHRNALQQGTPTVHRQLIYCFHEAELINERQRTASPTHRQLAKRRFMASGAASKGAEVQTSSLSRP